MTLTPEQVQPGALNEDREPLRVVHDDGGDSVTVVDRIQAGRGGYLIVADENGSHTLVPEATVLENYSPVASDQENENEALRQRIAELEAQQQDRPDAPPPDPAQDPAAQEPAPPVIE